MDEIAQDSSASHLQTLSGNGSPGQVPQRRAEPVACIQRLDVGAVAEPPFDLGELLV